VSFATFFFLQLNIHIYSIILLHSWHKYVILKSNLCVFSASVFTCDKVIVLVLAGIELIFLPVAAVF